MKRYTGTAFTVTQDAGLKEMFCSLFTKKILNFFELFVQQKLT